MISTWPPQKARPRSAATKRTLAGTEAPEAASRSRFIAWLAGWLAAAGLASAQPPEPAATEACTTRAVESIQRRYQAVRDLSADFLQQSARLPGGVEALRRQVPHLIGDHGEAETVFLGARGLDGGIQREQVRLPRDAGDGLRKHADALRHSRQPGDG